MQEIPRPLLTNNKNTKKCTTLLRTYYKNTQKYQKILRNAKQQYQQNTLKD